MSGEYYLNTINGKIEVLVDQVQDLLAYALADEYCANDSEIQMFVSRLYHELLSRKMEFVMIMDDRIECNEGTCTCGK